MIQKKQLGEIALLQRGLTYNKGDEVPSSSKIVLRSNNIDLESHSLDLSELKYLREDFVIPEDRKVKKDSIFICMSNGSKQHVGKVAYIDRDMNYAFGGFMGLIIPAPFVSAKYVYYACNSSSYRTFLSQIGNGIGITNLRFSDLEKFEIPIPSKEEQKAIVEELDLLSSVIDKKNQQVRDIDSVIMALFYEKCEVFLNDNSYYTPLENVCTLLTDGDWIESKDQSEDGIRLIQTGNVGVGVYKDKAEKSRFISEETFKRLNCTEVLPGDILISRLPDPVGRACVIPSLPKRMITSVDCSIIRLNESILPSVLVQYTKTREYYRHLENYITGATRKRISRKNLSRVPFLIPPMTVQKEVEECYNALVRTQQQINESIQETRRLLESRMDRYFNQ